jgi:hypothetical protein
MRFTLNTLTDFINHFTNIEFTFSLNDEFDMNNFKNSVEKISSLLDIPIHIKNIDDIIIVFNVEIYFIISNNNLLITCSHIYYDASSIFTILNLIDSVYNKKEITIPIIIDPKIKQNKNNLSSILCNCSSLLKNFIRKEKMNIDCSNSNIFSCLYKTTNVFKTNDIINELQYLFKEYNMIILINSRKTFKLDENTIGCYILFFCLQKGNKHLIDNLKKCKDLNDLNNTFINADESEVITINSYLNFNNPSFVNEFYPPFITNSMNNKTIFITPKNKLGESKIYMSKELLESIN